MGIIAKYVAVSTDALDRIRKDDRLLQVLFNPDDDEDISIAQSLSENRIDLDKAWDGVWYLISSERRASVDPYEPSDLLGRAVDGSTLLHESAAGGDGPRWIPAQEVHQIATSLAELQDKDLVKHFDPAAMRDAQVYPGDWDQIGVDYILRAFRKLQRFYSQASVAAQAVIVWIS